MSDNQPTKAVLRQQFMDKRKTVDRAARRNAGIGICKHIMDDPLRLMLRAWRVSLYLSTKYEIPTRYLARKIWHAGREVCVPAWSLREHAYRLYTLTPDIPLIPGHHGIREPAVHIPVLTWDVDAFIVPGLVFDTKGGRLGYGAGYYDRILANAVKSAVKIGVCYDWQISDTPLPQEPHDIPMNWIVTDKRIIDCASNNQKKKNYEHRTSKLER